MNNNFINDNRLYMVFTDDNNKKHKAYHVVNGELVKTPEYEAHLASQIKEQETDKKLAKIEKKITKIAAITLASLLVIGTAAKITMNIKENKEKTLRLEQEMAYLKEYPTIEISTGYDQTEEIQIHIAERYEEQKTNKEGKTYTESTLITTDGKTYRSIYTKYHSFKHCPECKSLKIDGKNGYITYVYEEVK